MNTLGIAYNSERISLVLKEETNSYGNLIGLNFKIRDYLVRKGIKRDKASPYGFRIVPPDNSFIVEKVFLKEIEPPFYYKFFFIEIPEQELPVQSIYHQDPEADERLPLVPANVGVNPKHTAGDLQYHTSVAYDTGIRFDFAFFSREELLTLALLGDEIIFSGSKITFGRLTQHLYRLTKDEFDPTKSVFTLKADSNLKKYLDFRGYSTNISELDEISTRVCVSGSFFGQPCPPVWIPDIALKGDLTLDEFFALGRAWKAIADPIII